jgi:hypothetical protein
MENTYMKGNLLLNEPPLATTYFGLQCLHNPTISDTGCREMHSMFAMIGWQLQQILHSWDGPTRIRFHYATEADRPQIPDMLSDALQKAGSADSLNEMIDTTDVEIRRLTQNFGQIIFQCLGRFSRPDLQKYPHVDLFLTTPLAIHIQE